MESIVERARVVPFDAALRGRRRPLAGTAGQLFRTLGNARDLPTATRVQALKADLLALRSVLADDPPRSRRE